MLFIILRRKNQNLISNLDFKNIYVRGNIVFKRLLMKKNQFLDYF